MKFEYHFEPTKGWMNDPNGLCYFKGQYHAFFQHNPHAPKWDTMHWGHAVSKDLIHWTETDIALYPDMEYENKGGCFSGSAIGKDGKLHLFYTSVSHRLGQTQSMAASTDGVHFDKYMGNPIIPRAPFVAEGGFTKDFRDPKVIEAFGRYYMVCGTCRDGVGQVLLYTSDDLIGWQYLGVAYASDRFGGTPECPDLFPLEDRWVLMFSAMKPTVAATVFVIGDFDGKQFFPEKETYSEYGRDFYAPQTLLAPDGRRIMIGWFYHWGKPLPEGNEVAGALSIARELTIIDGNVVNYPVREAAHLLTEECEYVKINGTVLTVMGLDGQLVYEKDFADVSGIEKIDKVEILFDRKAVEIFLNGGAASVAQWLI